MKSTKKKRVIALLLAAIMFVSMFSVVLDVNAAGYTVVFNLEHYLDNPSITSLTDIPALSATPGGHDIQFVNVHTTRSAIEITGRTDQAHGIDILHSEIGFEVGDTVTVTGRILQANTTAWGAMILNANPGGWNEAVQGDNIGGTGGIGDFTLSFTLTAAHIGLITGANPQGIRVQTNYAANAEFTIDNIRVTRPAGTVPGNVKYSLASDSIIQGLNAPTVLDVAAHPQFSASGSIVTNVREYDNTNYLHVTDRTAGSNGLQVTTDGLSLAAGDTVRITGRVGYAVPSGWFVMSLNLINGASGWNERGQTGSLSGQSHGLFTIEYILSPADIAILSAPGGTIRIMSNHNSDANLPIVDYFIHTIDIGTGLPPVTFTPPAPDAPGILPPDGDETVLWSLADDSGIQALAVGHGGATDEVVSATPHLGRAGETGAPIMTIVPHPDSGNAIEVSSRSQTWHALDIWFDPLNLAMGGEYVFRASGRTVGTVPTGTQMQLNMTDAPYGHYAQMAPAGSVWALEHHMTQAQLTAALLGEQRGVRIQTNGSGSHMTFIVDEIEVIMIGEPPVQFTPLHEITFDDASWAVYENYIAPGSQMSGTRVTDHGMDDDFSFRLENITGNYTSGDGNYLRFDLPEPLPLGTLVQLSWDVYVPSALNPPPRDLVGPSININSEFGSLPHQPTNLQPPPGDLARTTPMDEWFNTTVEFTVSTDISELEHIIFRFRVNNNTQQPSVYFIDNIILSVGGSVDIVVPEWDLTLPSLAEAFEQYFMFGNIYPGTTSAVINQVNTREMYLHHFNAITAENHHKPDLIAGPNNRLTRPTVEEFNFDQADAIVDWAIDNDIVLVGHAFVWHSQSPLWMFSSAPGVPLTRDEARDNMEFYIRTLSEHFASRGVLGAFYSWDVVNEVITSGGGSWDGPLDDWNAGDWRTQMRTDSGWWQAYSNNPSPSLDQHPSDFVYDAFVLARRYFPYSVLYYNDYNEEIPAKRNAIGQMVEQLNERWAHDLANNPEAVAEGALYTGRLLIEGIGMQSHYHLSGWTTNLDNVRAAIERFVAAGTLVSITELDITVGGFGGPAPDVAALPALFLQQAAAYERLFGYYLEFADYIERVSIWGLADHQSWRAAGHPLLFDTNLNAKPAFDAIFDALSAHEAVHGLPSVSAPDIAAAALPNGEPNVRYTVRLTAERNNHAPVLWTIASGNLPPGLVLHSRTGIIEGVPTATGNFTFTVAAENAGGRTTGSFLINIPADSGTGGDSGDGGSGDGDTGGGDSGDGDTGDGDTGGGNQPNYGGGHYVGSGQNGSQATPTTPAAPSATIPINHGEVEINVRVQRTRATLNTNTTLIREIIASVDDGAEVVTFDLSTLNVTEVLIPRQAVRQLANAALGMEVILPTGTLVLDAEATGFLGQEARSNNIVVSISGMDASDLPEGLQLTPDQVVHQVTISVGTQIINAFDGTLTVSLPYDGPIPVTVWIINEDGELVLFEPDAVFDSETGLVTFETDMLGLFVLGYSAEPAPAWDETVYVVQPVSALTPVAPTQTSMRLFMDNTTFANNGVTSQSVAAPFIDPETNRAMVPLRHIAEVFGAAVDWDSDTRTVTMHTATDIVTLTIGEALPNDMGTAVIVDDLTFVPLRFVATALGVEVEWDENERAVNIVM